MSEKKNMKPGKGRPAVILLVEDNPDDQELARRALEHGKIHNQLYIARDGKEALDYLYQRGHYSEKETAPKPDLILLDLNMPRMNGTEFLTVIRQDPAFKNLPIVVLTTSSRESDIANSYDLGCNSVVQKPMNRSEMVRLFEFIEYYWLQLAVLPSET